MKRSKPVDLNQLTEKIVETSALTKTLARRILDRVRDFKENFVWPEGTASSAVPLKKTTGNSAAKRKSVKLAKAKTVAKPKVKSIAKHTKPKLKVAKKSTKGRKTRKS
jgi:hypothetical protein